MNKKVQIILSIVLACTLLTACTDKTNLKKEAQVSVTKQAEMRNYSFTGTADIDLGTLPQTKDSNPITTNLLTLIEKSKLEWTGVASVDPVQLEVNLKSSSGALGIPLELPMLIKDNKLYISIPMLNKKDEYFAIDLTTLGTMAGSKTPLTPDSLKNVIQTTSTLSNLILTDIQDKWFQKSKDPITLKDGTVAKILNVEITDKNIQEISLIFQSKLPEMIDILAKSGIISTEQAEKLKQADLKSIQMRTPGILSLTIDPTGFIREQKINLTYTMKNKEGNLENRHLNVSQAYDHINQSPKFEKQTPTQIRPFEHILKFMNGIKK